MLATVALGAAQVCSTPSHNTTSFSSLNPKHLSFFKSVLQSPWGVASGAIAGHLVATLLAIMGGAFLANYISEKLVPTNTYTSPFTETELLTKLMKKLVTFLMQVGYVGGALFLVFAAATFFGVF